MRPSASRSVSATLLPSPLPNASPSPPRCSTCSTASPCRPAAGRGALRGGSSPGCCTARSATHRLADQMSIRPEPREVREVGCQAVQQRLQEHSRRLAPATVPAAAILPPPGTAWASPLTGFRAETNSLKNCSGVPMATGRRPTGPGPAICEAGKRSEYGRTKDVALCMLGRRLN